MVFSNNDNGVATSSSSSFLPNYVTQNEKQQQQQQYFQGFTQSSSAKNNLNYPTGNDLEDKEATTVATTNDGDDEDGSVLFRADAAIKENIIILPTYIKEQAMKARSLALDGPGLSFRVMAFVAGVFMTVTAILNIGGSILVLNFREVVISLYVFLFGIITCLIEGKAWACPAEWRRKVRYYCKILEFTWGRGIFYIFAGLLQFSQGKFILDRFSGFIMMLIGGLSIVASAGATEKLASLREAIHNNKELFAKFEEFDKDNDGYIVVSEFASLCGTLGVSLTYHELVASFANIDQDEDERISYDEFQNWWSNGDTQSSLFYGLDI